MSAFDILRNFDVVMVDFGLASRYMDKKTGEHVRKENVSTFRGNSHFASVNQLKFRRTSRRDDLQSLFYLLVCLLHGGHILGEKCELSSSSLTVEILHKLSKIK